MVNRNSHCYHGLITIDSYAKTHTIIIIIIIIIKNNDSEKGKKRSLVKKVLKYEFSAIIL